MDDIAAWIVAFSQARADKVFPTPGGCAILTPSFPGSHDHNKLMVVNSCDGTELVRAADDALAGYSHRRIEVFGASLGDALEPALVAAGYERNDDLVMTYAGPGARTASPSHVIEVLSLEERIELATAGWAEEQPEWAPELWAELGSRARTAVRAGGATFLGIRVDGQVVARADLFVGSSIAQVEEVMTDGLHQGKGYASALVLDAVSRAQATGSVEQVFLVADSEDWPKDLYAALGFVEHSRIAAFARY